MSKVQSFLTPKEIKATRKQAQEIYNCLIGYAIANEDKAGTTILPNFIAAWRSKSQTEAIKVLRQHDADTTSLHMEFTALNDSYKPFAKTKNKVITTTDAEGRPAAIETDEIIPCYSEDGLFIIEDEAKMKEYKEAIELFKYQEKLDALNNKQYTLVAFRIKAEEMMKIKSAVSYEGTTMGNNGQQVSTTVFPDYSIMYELIFG